MKRMFPWLITVLLSITLIFLVVFLVVLKPANEHTASTTKKPEAVKKLSAAELVKVTSEIAEIKTNLADPTYIVSMSFAFQLNNDKAKESFDQISNFKVKPIIIKLLADKQPGELSGAKGKDEFCTELLNQIEKVLPEGSLKQVEITSFVITSL